MKFNYTKITTDYCDEATDNHEQYGEDFSYEPREADLEKELVKIVTDYYILDNFFETEFTEKQKERLRKCMKELIDACDLWGTFKCDYYDELHDAFEEEALENYGDLEYEGRNRYGY